jgi:hypothetical protein
LASSAGITAGLKIERRAAGGVYDFFEEQVPPPISLGDRQGRWQEAENQKARSNQALLKYFSRDLSAAALIETSGAPIEFGDNIAPGLSAKLSYIAQKELALAKKEGALSNFMAGVKLLVSEYDGNRHEGTSIFDHRIDIFPQKGKPGAKVNPHRDDKWGAMKSSLRGSSSSVAQRACKCGSVAHQRITHRECPMNPSREKFMLL